jgi:hypothetical protein
MDTFSKPPHLMPLTRIALLNGHIRQSKKKYDASYTPPVSAFYSGGAVLSSTPYGSTIDTLTWNLILHHIKPTPVARLHLMDSSPLDVESHWKRQPNAAPLSTQTLTMESF